MKKMFLLFLCVLFVFGTLVGCSKNEENKTALLTEKELEFFNGDEFFNNSVFNVESFNIRNQFLSSLYDTPEKISLSGLFYCGSGIEEIVTEEEKNAGIKYNGWEAEQDCQCQKISGANMDAVLTKYMGLTRFGTDGVGLDNFTYLEEYDAYYLFHGDTNYRATITLPVVSARAISYVDDLFMGDGNKILTLREQNGNYLFVSNKKQE